MIFLLCDDVTESSKKKSNIPERMSCVMLLEQTPDTATSCGCTLAWARLRCIAEGEQLCHGRD